MIVTQICFSLLFSLAFRATGVITFPIERRHLRGCVVLATVWCVPLPARPSLLRDRRLSDKSADLREHAFSAHHTTAHTP